MLYLSLEQNALQTYPPKEIIVVDSSDDWQQHSAHVLENIAPKYPHITWIYEQALIRSSATQRNQGAQLASGDILFMFDDDSLVYKDCAENIMAIYNADLDQRVAGVNAVHVSSPPDGAELRAQEVPAENPTTKNYNPLVRAVRDLLQADNIYVPYDPDFPKHHVPETLNNLNVGRRRLLVGWGMTFRRDVFLQEEFEPLLRYYSSGEDSDLSYRISRHGVLLTAFDARLHHVGSVGGRLSEYVVTVFGALNPLVLHRLHSTNLSLSKQRSRNLLWRRLIIGLLKDLKFKDTRLQRSRGIFKAIRLIDKIFAMSVDELNAWYPNYQAEMIESNRKN